MLLAAGLASQALGAPAPARPLFSSDHVLELELAGPLEATLADREARDYRPFTLRLTAEDGTSIPLQVRVRGKSRAAICELAPLRLDFDSDATAGTPFAGQNKLKLVLPCHDSDRAERDVLEEYAAYRIFGLLSDTAYRVRLLRLHLIDTEAGGGKTLLDRHAFLLESNEELTSRTGLPKAGLPAVRRGELEPDQAATVFIFQYLIGNTDWSLVAPENETDCCHNIRLLGREAPIYAVPFDFDLSGLVSARYAKPDPSLNLRSVSQRLYRGYCIDSAALGLALDRIVASREAVLAVPQSLSMLSDRQVRSRVRYLEDFFEQAADRDRLLRRFEKLCL